MDDDRDTCLPQWFWLWLPLVLYFGYYGLRAFASPHFFDRFILHESGFTEQATVVVSAFALLIGLVVLVRVAALDNRRLLILYAVFCLGCFYLTGEEASWGQHWLGWHTPAEWDSLNNQDETNLHNLDGLAGSLLDQLPRNMISLAALVGGAIIPLVRRARGQRYEFGSFAWWVMPGLVCIPSGLIAALATIPQKVCKAIADDVVWPMDINAGEVKELMIALFLLIYIAAVWLRLRQHPSASRCVG